MAQGTWISSSTEGIGPIDDGDVHFAPWEERLQILHRLAEQGERLGDFPELDGEVDVAVRVLVTRDRRPELEQQSNAVLAGDPGDEVGVHEPSASPSL